MWFWLSISNWMFIINGLLFFRGKCKQTIFFYVNIKFLVYNIEESIKRDYNVIFIHKTKTTFRLCNCVSLIYKSSFAFLFLIIEKTEERTLSRSNFSYLQTLLTQIFRYDLSLKNRNKFCSSLTNTDWLAPFICQTQVWDVPSCFVSQKNVNNSTGFCYLSIIVDKIMNEIRFLVF